MPLCKERLECTKFNINNAGCHDPKGYFCFVGVKKEKAPVALDSFAKATRYILYEIEANPEESLRDIANNALMDNKIPLACKMIEGDYAIVPHEWKTD